MSALEDALEAALAVYDVEGEKALRSRFDLAQPRHVTIRDGRRYDADLLGHLILGAAGPRAARLGEQSAAAVVAAAGATVVRIENWSVENELLWRMSAWQQLQRADVNAEWLRERGLYGGMQGIWVDAARTKTLAPEGVAVAVRHTGRHYADDVDDKMAIYYYPRTIRPAARDRHEIEAVKNAAELHLPVFVIGEGPGGARPVRLAWVIAADDEAEVFLLEFAEAEPRHLDIGEPHVPFELTSTRQRAAARQQRYVRSPEFKFRVLHRHQGKCAVTGVGVPVVLDAAHVVPVEDGGTDDERNGLLLTATLHRAFDAYLWAIEPGTHRLRTRRQGPTLADLQVTATALRQGVKPPHPDALEWRWLRFRAKGDAAVLGEAVAEEAGR
ncbi:HNH endonuclease [Cellulomonas sp. APG4]|uniref:HNH endonuclease n=1 Tax=Cellulomonas sp. APG4 TaxID=1538656 RepID=UPI001379C2F2|nr:HNH endonuclease [Cellulomonas sp. APG4]